jgi:hypothetical protein
MKNSSLRLLFTDELHRSWVVANSLMNRARNCSGSNGYERELGFDPTVFLLDRLADRPTVAWLDLGCGTGRALVQCATRLTTRVPAKRFRVFGVVFPFRYLGADDTAGPNYTGQPAVDSYYEKV